ncbi:MAG TPA: phosphate ABC transporter substrate-binding protein [Firmicutes bacterium]|nr:phosphate ABC transporter substrate-binding protein [Bacillota bacterium]
MIFIIGLALAALGGCGLRRGRPDVGGAHQSITLAGSTSVQPFAELLADEFMKSHPGIIVNVQGGGSSAGARAALTGVAQIGMLSRELEGEEKSLHRIVIARDAIAIVVHPSNPIDDLSVAQIRAIFAGEITNWSQVGGPHREIHVVSREEGSGTRGSFDEMIMGSAEVTPGAVVQDSNGAVRETVAGDPSAIGYLSLGLVDKRVKGVRISGVAPTVANVERGAYGIVRPFLFATRGRPGEAAQEFIDFALSRAGQRLLAAEGLVPVARD